MSKKIVNKGVRTRQELSLGVLFCYQSFLLNYLAAGKGFFDSNNACLEK